MLILSGVLLHFLSLIFVHNSKNNASATDFGSKICLPLALTAGFSL